MEQMKQQMQGMGMTDRLNPENGSETETQTNMENENISTEAKDSSVTIEEVE